MLIILTTNITPRLSYAAKQVFERILSIPYLLTDHRNYNPNSSDFVVHYATDSADSVHSIYKDEFCSEYVVRNFKPELTIYKEKPVYFHSSSSGNSYPVDIFSLVFYFLNRYEEYNANAFDNHGRFRSIDSIAGLNKHLDFPIVDYWVRDFGSYLKSHFPGLTIPEPLLKFIPTFDIDHAWKYKNKGFLRNLGGMIKDLTKFSIESISKRISVISANSKDPYFTFKEIQDTHKDLKLIYFILLGDYSSLDINISTSNSQFQQLLKDLSDSNELGIHPSYASNKSPNLLLKEINILSSITGKKPTKSRQHFLKLSFPQTYQNLIKAGITEDYTMGYADAIGFRAGTAYSFDWYDLSKEEATELMIFPFIAMDITLRDYLKLPPREAFSKLREIYNSLQITGGNFITIWHNSSFCDADGWEEWVIQYKDFIKSLSSNK